TAGCPAQLLESALEHCSGDLPFRIVFGKRHQHADPPHPVGLLCLRRERPRRCCAADCGQQFPPSDGDCHTPLPCEVRKWNDTTSLPHNRARPPQYGCSIRQIRVPLLPAFAPDLFSDVAGLDHDRRRHARVQRAEIFVSAGLSEVKAKLSSVASAFALNSWAAEVMVCGMSSSLRQVTVVPAFTVRRAGYEGKIVDFGGCVSRTHRAEKRTTATSRQATPVETRELRDL